MAVVRDRPYAGMHFLVDLGLDDPAAPQAGFSEVIIPTLHAPTQPRRGEQATRTPSEPLVLRRGVTGTLDLYAWWSEASHGKARQRRTVRVDLLDESGQSVLSWTFRNVRPLSLTYSPLNAMDGAVLIETIELAFDRVEMS